MVQTVQYLRSMSVVALVNLMNGSCQWCRQLHWQLNEVIKNKTST